MKPPEMMIEILPWNSNSPIDDPAYEPEVVEGFKQMKRKYGVWGWCNIEVEASFGEFSGSDFLSACSYKSKQDFMQCDYFNTMQSEALANLEQNIRKAEETIAAYRAIHPKETP